MRWARSSLGLLFALALAAGPAAAAESAKSGKTAAEDEPMHWDFVVGRYDLVGRPPDGGKPYAGTARIERAGRHLKLTRTIAGRSREVFGVVRRADPGEAWVLAFAWGTKPAMEMVCLIGGDLDNYARLTCHWGRAGNPHKKPGVEAYFAQAPWEPVAD